MMQVKLCGHGASSESRISIGRSAPAGHAESNSCKVAWGGKPYLRKQLVTKNGYASSCGCAA
eukprot:6348042-Amphidinium_carterae.2